MDAKQKRLETRVAGKSGKPGLIGTIGQIAGAVLGTPIAGPVPSGAGVPQQAVPPEQKDYTMWVVGGVSLLVVAGIIVAVSSKKKRQRIPAPGYLT